MQKQIEETECGYNLHTSLHTSLQKEPVYKQICNVQKEHKPLCLCWDATQIQPHALSFKAHSEIRRGNDEKKILVSSRVT